MLSSRGRSPSRRQTWVNVHESRYATHRQIAQAIGIGRRTMELWVSRYRAAGAEGLLDRARSGAPRKVTEMMRRRQRRTGPRTDSAPGWGWYGTPTPISRRGSQENIFKYLIEEFDLDAMYTYGAEHIPEELDHPHPACVKLEKAAAKLRRQRTQRLAKMDELAGAGTTAAQYPGREATAEHRRTEELAQHLNQLQARYPGSRRVLVFEPTPVPEAGDTAPQKPPRA